jgi:steroid 5-alpha reductase family enzyme
MSTVQLAFAALASSLACSLSVWVISVMRQNVAFADRVWSVLIMVSAAVFVIGLPPLRDRVAVMLLVGTVWALRLSLFITWRSWGQPEDRRYALMRERGQPHFEWKSMITVFALQALLAWLVAMPFLAASVSPGAANPWSTLDSLGLALALFGLLFEATADLQMMNFKANKIKSNTTQPGAVMSKGLWHYSRHPNYFGESCVWWGLGLMAVSAGGAWALLSPVLVTILVLKVSGTNLQEPHLQSRSPAYSDYMRRTSAFVPRPPKTS